MGSIDEGAVLLVCGLAAVEKMRNESTSTAITIAKCEERPSSLRTFVISILQKAPRIAAPSARCHSEITRSPDTTCCSRKSRLVTKTPLKRIMKVVLSIDLNCKQGYQSYGNMPDPTPNLSVYYEVCIQLPMACWKEQKEKPLSWSKKWRRPR